MNTQPQSKNSAPEKEAHTAGPWDYGARLSASENHKGFYVGPGVRAHHRLPAGCHGGVGAAVIAEVYPLDEDGVKGQANARLIASAPQLLEALERIAATELDFREANRETFYQRLLPFRDYDYQRLSPFREAVEEGRTAIAAARGEV